jgi:competence protein ComEC
MLLVPAFAILSRKRLTPLSGIGTALLLVLVFDPLSTLSPGFWLSFAAVGIIIFRLAGRIAAPGWLGKSLGLQFSIAIGLAPFLLAQFGQLPTASAIANLFAVPWVSVTVVPLTLLGAFFSVINETVAAWLLQLADLAIGVFWYFLIGIESSGLFPVVSLVSTPAAVAFAGAGVLLLLLPRGSGFRVLCVFLFLPLLTHAERALPPGELQVIVLDVGQGLSVLVRTTGKTLLYDTGGRLSANFNAGDAVIVPTLKVLGVPSVDKLIISHSDMDHRGGLQAIVANIPVKEVISSDPGAIGVESSTCRGGQHWQWDGVQFDMLHPTDQFNHASTNNRSCVLRITTGAASVLLPGDIERAAERVLLSTDELRSDILIAPHHGSSTSSSRDFVERVKPRHVVYSVGYRHRLGHPKAEVERRYADTGTRAWRTDRDGAIVFEWSSRDGQWSVYSYRSKLSRFWSDKTHRPAFTTEAE